MRIALNARIKASPTHTSRRIFCNLRIPFGHDAGNPQGDHRPGTMREYRSGGTPWLVVVDPQRNVVFNDFRLSATRFIDWLTPQLEA